MDDTEKSCHACQASRLPWGIHRLMPEAAVQPHHTTNSSELTQSPAKKSSRPHPSTSIPPHNRQNAGQQSQIRECSHVKYGFRFGGPVSSLTLGGTRDFQMEVDDSDRKIWTMADRARQQRRRMPYNTISNKTRTIKTPGGQLRALHLKKRGTAPKCMEDHELKMRGKCGLTIG
jgi:hypothetical protein